MYNDHADEERLSSEESAPLTVYHLKKIIQENGFPDVFTRH